MAFAIIVMSGSKPENISSAAAEVSPEANGRSDALARCRTLAQPDEACTRLWETERRRFFGQDDLGEEAAGRHE